MDHSKFPINLIGELVAVRPDPINAYSQAIERDGRKLLLPDWKRSLSGIILGKGPDCKNTSEGDRVAFGAAVGMDSILNGQEIRILKEQDLDFIYEA